MVTEFFLMGNAISKVCFNVFFPLSLVLILLLSIVS